MVNKLKRIMGTAVFVVIMATSVLTMVQASGVHYFLQGERMNTAYGNYSDYFMVTGTASTPYLKYLQVYTNGNYGVTSLYRDGNSDKNISIKTYYASSIAQGLVLSDLELKTLKNNRILVYRSSASYVDILIDYLQVEY